MMQVFSFKTNLVGMRRCLVLYRMASYIWFGMTWGFHFVRTRVRTNKCPHTVAAGSTASAVLECWRSFAKPQGKQNIKFHTQGLIWDDPS